MQGWSAPPAAPDGWAANPVGPDGLEPSPSSLQGRCTATRALGPWVRGAGVEPAVPIAPGLRPGAVPRRRPADGDRLRPPHGKARGHRSHCWRSLQLSRCYLGATNQGIEVNRLVALAGARGLEPRPRRVWGPLGYRCAAPSCAVVCAPFGPEFKRAAPLRKRLERSWTGNSPVQTVEDAPLGRRSKSMAWPKATCDVTHAANRPLWPSIHRWPRS